METTILEKATGMFLKQGYKTVTMDDISSELNISKRTLYEYYSSKSELIEKSLTYVNKQFLNQLESIIALKQDALQEMFSLHHDTQKIFEIDSSAAAYELHKYYPKLGNKQKKYYKKKYVALIKKNLEKGIKEGVYRSDFDVDFVSVFMIVSFSAINDLDYFPESEYEHNDKRDLHLEYHLRSIISPKGMKSLETLLKKL
ncbi:TetR/AcrR family transcriptional regulator [Myroides injenensis]|uniref:TetR/AcrR family transcriptional regulator n=1 Tax=Myroides injenensis TaxID=1183151 RepID=UPI0022719ED6|nr:TetR/AcrR family transcriptional regulator [Myroides injenensis]